MGDSAPDQFQIPATAVNRASTELAADESYITHGIDQAEQHANTQSAEVESATEERPEVIVAAVKRYAEQVVAMRQGVTSE